MASSDIGTWQIDVELNDGFMPSPAIYTFIIIVTNTAPYLLSLTNLGPPVFMEDIPTEIEIQALSKYVLVFPSIIDPDNDDYLVRVDLG